MSLRVSAIETGSGSRAAAVCSGIPMWRIFAQEKTQQTEESTEKATNNAKAAQLLGIRGASEEDNIWKIRLQLTKPVTWVPLIWGTAVILSATLLCRRSLRRGLWRSSIRSF